MKRISHSRQPVCVCYGLGVDSTALLVGFAQRGIRPDLITFADTGGEKTQTYLFAPVMQQWLRDQHFPSITVCRYVPPIAPYNSLLGNCEANQTIPSLAFGRKSCSLKWKRDAQEPLRRRLPENVQAWSQGWKVSKCIGFDASETRRTYAGVGQERDEYDYWYPLQDWGWDRDRCQREIANAGLPVPPKSACFFCPAMKQAEIVDLQRSDPQQVEIALRMEQNYINGKHWRFECNQCQCKFKRENMTEAKRCPSCNSEDLRDASTTRGIGRRYAWGEFLDNHHGDQP